MLPAIILLILFTLLVFFLFYWIIGWISSPYYPSRVRKLEAIFDELKYDIKPTTKFLDMGSGDGRVVEWASKKGMLSHGVELNPFLSLFSRTRKHLRNDKNIEIYNKSFFKHKLHEYNIVYLYLLPGVMGKLESKLLNEMTPGSIIISNTFKLPNTKEDKILDNFYIYHIK